MRKLKKLLIIAALSIATLSVTACTSDNSDPDSGGNGNNLVTRYIEVDRPGIANPVPCVITNDYHGLALSCDWSN